MNRVKNASRNAFYGMILKVYQIIMPFVVRTAMIYLMGVEYAGLNGLFTSILHVLNLAELGVGLAMIYSMYKPIADQDETTICALLKLYKIYYRLIGLVLAIVGGILTPFVPKLISGDVPAELNVYILYLLNLGATVLSYWLFAYKRSLLQAHQRTDIISKITLIINTIQYSVQVLVLWLYHDYYLFVIVALFTQALTNVVTAIVSDKIYPAYQPKGKLNKEQTQRINKRIKDLFTAKIGGVFSTAVDNVVISAFLGLTMLAIYQNYYYIFTSVISVIKVIFESCTAGIGNSLVTESSEKNYNDFKKLSFLTMWICVICISCFASMYQPFMILWVGEDLLLSDFFVALMCIYLFVYVVQTLNFVYKDAAGIWHKDRFRPLVVGVANLILNIGFVRFWGIYAIVLSTIISFTFIGMPWLIHNLFSLVFKRSPREYVLEVLKSFTIAVISGILCYYIGIIIPIQGVVGVIARCAISIALSNTLFIVLRRKNKVFNSTLDLINKMTKHKFNFMFSLIKTKEN